MTVTQTPRGWYASFVIDVMEPPPAPVDVVTDILANWGLMSDTAIKQEATALECVVVHLRTTLLFIQGL